MRRTPGHGSGVAALTVAELLGDGLDADMLAVVAIGEAPLAGTVDRLEGQEVADCEVGQVDGVGAAVLAVVGGDEPFADIEAHMLPLGAQQFADAATGGERQPQRGLTGREHRNPPARGGEGGRVFEMGWLS